MRPVIAEWLFAHGLPAWLAPDYIVMGGIAGLVAGYVILRSAAPEDRAAYARALVLAYVAAYAGGTLFEALRSVPAWLSGDGELSLGRAAWGGLFGAVLAAWIAVRVQKKDARAFFDRVSVGIGVIFGFVRIGCFLGGCDYGRPSALAWAVRFPPGSFAADAHAQLGWIAAGTASLAVHPTQLYEALFGFVSAGVIALLEWRHVFERRLLAVWLVLYAVFRFANETLRGDVDRGAWLSLSTAQLVSIVVLAGVVAWWLIDATAASRRRPSDPARSRPPSPT